MSDNTTTDRHKSTDAQKLFWKCSRIEGVNLNTKARDTEHCAQRAAFAMVCLHNKAVTFNTDIGLVIGINPTCLYHYKKNHEHNMKQKSEFSEKYIRFYGLFTSVWEAGNLKRIYRKNRVERIYARAVLGYI